MSSSSVLPVLKPLVTGAVLSAMSLSSAVGNQCDHSYDCGFPGITEGECLSRGCCFDSTPKPLQCSGYLKNCSSAQDCYNHGVCTAGLCQCDPGFAGAYCNQTQPPPYPDITTVHVINSCHLDIGFADSSAGIINRYFSNHLPHAAAVGAQMEKGVPGYSDHKLNFMFQSWVLDMFFDCPPNMGLACPDDDAQATVRAAIDAGHITWHAFPHNAQLEVMDPSLIHAGLELTFALDRQFNQSNKTTLSQRDVPGMTRGLIPILRKKGVTAVSIGANDGSTPPNVPPCFKWVDELSGESLIGLFNWPGYGSLPITHQMTCFAGEHALVYNWNGDNAGPFTAEVYAAKWKEIQTAFPNAQVVASTFDNFTAHLADHENDESLPVITKEIGDSWIYGVPSDPQKVSRMRVMNRVWAGVAAKAPDGDIGLALAADSVLRNATRFALKNGEHTWGRDVKSNLFDNYDWLNADFDRARAPGSPNASQYAILEESWWEQREWGITLAVDTLAAAKHPLADELVDGFAQLKPVVPDLKGFSAGMAGENYSCGNTTIAFDESGAIAALVNEGFVWADANHTLLSLKYRSYSAADVAAFFATYCKSNASWVQHDYGKPGLPSSVLGQIWPTTMTSLHIRSGPTGVCSFRVQSAFAAEASENYGAAAGWTTIDITPGSGNHNTSILIEVGMFNKSTTRLPEAMFMQFQPTPVNAEWSVDKLGEWVNPSEIVSGGTKHLHGVMEGGLRARTEDGRSMSIAALDAAVANFGELNAYPSPVNTTADTSTFGSSFCLWDNLWGTNYVMWWPFMVPPPKQYSASSKYFPSEGNNDMVSRFEITLN